jgi:hypothetical protein
MYSPAAGVPMMIARGEGGYMFRISLSTAGMGNDESGRLRTGGV